MKQKREVNRPSKTAIAQAMEAAKETKAMQAAPEFLQAVEKFTPIFGKLAQQSMSLMLGARDACEQVIKFLKIEPTKEGKKRAALVVRACTTDASVLTFSNRWLAVMLAEKKGASLGTISRELDEGWADVPCKVGLIETQPELLAASTFANASLGIKARNKGAKVKAATAATPDTVYDVLPRLLDDPVAFIKIKAILASKGWVVVTALEAASITAAQAAPSRIRRAA